MLERFRSILKWKKSYEEYASILSKEFGREVTVEELKELRKEMSNRSSDQDIEDSESEILIESDKPLNRQQLEELVQVDNKTSFLKRTQIKSLRNNTWTYALTIEYKQEEVYKEQIEKFFDSLKEYTPPKINLSDPNINPDLEEKNIAVISLTDFHLDKLSLHEKTTSSLIDYKKAIFRSTLQKLIYRAYRSFGLDEIVLVIGNDFFHTDTYFNSTTAGTPQDVCISWDKAYMEGFDLLYWAIGFCKSYCNKLRVVHVPSNHSKTKEFYLAHALKKVFEASNQSKSIVFDIESNPTKVYTFGKVFLGFTHGDSDINKLPLYFASKYGQQWGETIHRNVLIGHQHHRKDFKFTLGDREVEGIRISMLPSLSGVDKWHADKLFDLAVRSGVCKVYDKEYGYIAEFEERIHL